MRHPLRLSVFLVLLCGCNGHPSEVVRLARHIDITTMRAHMLLRAGFDASAQTEDAADMNLLQQVERLDEADNDLSDKVDRLERAATSRGNIDGLRRDVLQSLESIGARYAAVAQALRRRPIHDALRETIAAVPAVLSQIRARIGAPAH